MLVVYVLVLYTEDQMHYYCGYITNGTIRTTYQFENAAMFQNEDVVNEVNAGLNFTFMVEEHAIHI